MTAAELIKEIGHQLNNNSHAFNLIRHAIERGIELEVEFYPGLRGMSDLGEMAWADKPKLWVREVEE